MLFELAGWLGKQPGRQADAETVLREAADGGDPYALYALARWLGDQPGRQADAEQAYREAAATGNPNALRFLAMQLTPSRDGRPTPSRPCGRRPPPATRERCTSLPGRCTCRGGRPRLTGYTALASMRTAAQSRRILTDEVNRR